MVPLLFVRAQSGKPFRATFDDWRHIGIGFDIVDQGGAAPETFFRWIGRPGPGDAAATFDRFDQGGFLAADKGAGAESDLDVKIKAGTADGVAQEIFSFCLTDGQLEPLHSQRIFGPYINVTIAGTDRISGDDHSLQHSMGRAFKNGSVHEGAGVALVGIANQVFFASPPLWLRWTTSARWDIRRRLCHAVRSLGCGG